MFDLMYRLTSLLFFDMPLLSYYIKCDCIILLMLSFFWRYKSFYRYLYFTFNHFWSILWLFFDNFINDFITNQIISCFCCFFNCSFWSSFKCICGWLFSIIGVSGYIYCLSLCLFVTNVFAHIFSKRQKSITFFK